MSPPRPEYGYRKEIPVSKPVHEIRFGLIKASIWQNMTRAGERFKVTLTRLFRNGDTWSQSSQLGRDDLLLAAKVLDQAHTWIYQHDRHETPIAEHTDEHR